ncbi:hypothetical protein [Streptomyces sp. CAU 1734]|uniref:hypothetical protein n=1 Tax=Streptomyces sp. CAU 1734 TaxID=3140360 RepID=UPI00326195AA
MSAATAPAAPAAERAGQRVEEILDRLAAAGDPAAAEAAEELVRALMEFYGAGLARVVALLGSPAARQPGAEAESGTAESGTAGAGTGPLAGLLGDELVASLLVLHGIHPEDTAARIARALASVRDHPVELVDFDPATGLLRLRSPGGSGCGCPSTASAARQAVENALACFAPEVTGVELRPAAGPREPALIQIGTRPPAAAGPARAGHPAPGPAPVTAP